jgi:hypothetical protein
MEAGADAKLNQHGPLGVVYHPMHPISAIQVTLSQVTLSQVTSSIVNLSTVILRLFNFGTVTLS